MLLNHATDMVYIGQAKYTAERRFKQHLKRAFKDNSTTRIAQALRFYGESCFEVLTLEICQTQKQLNEREIWWIDYCCSREHAVGYNDERGGNVKEFTEEMREKCRAAGKKGSVAAKLSTAEILKRDPNFFKRCGAMGTPSKITPQRRREDMTKEELQRYAEWGKLSKGISKKHKIHGETS